MKRADYAISDTRTTSHEEAREKINADLAPFLASGGVVQQIAIGETGIQPRGQYGKNVLRLGKKGKT